MRATFHQNAIGSVTELTQPTGAVVEWVAYDVYGLATVRDKSGIVVLQSAVGNTVLFTGRDIDSETGLYDFRARTFDPATGRFLQRDPLGYAPGHSLYCYASASPT